MSISFSQGSKEFGLYLTMGKNRNNHHNLAGFFEWSVLTGDGHGQIVDSQSGLVVFSKMEDGKKIQKDVYLYLTG
ncbi:MAG: hypothetical protein GY860_10510 [Desulfobacteraceae bacterium]|nr:hypothetical protein [Desulfobacteraceae bacterium]